VWEDWTLSSWRAKGPAVVPDHRRQRISDPAAEQEIKHEQAVVDAIYARLGAATTAAKSLAEEGHARARLGNEGGLVERDAMVFQAAKRLATLDAASEGLVFGRLDLSDATTRYIGRLGLRDADKDVLLVDWRAPAAAVFYQATAQTPAGVVRRRVLQSRGDQVVGLEDDLLDADAAPDDMVVVGEGALIAALTRSRDRLMHSVVATIQKEQDEAIRSPSAGVTEISGGPGTGKTVVALHRAAYLLYTDRRRYEGGGVLVIGPNAVFMAYIERVLPSLGETSVSLRALGEVVDGIAATRRDAPDTAVVKGSARMREVLARTARGPVPDAPTSFRLFYRDDVLTLDSSDLSRLRRTLLASGQHRNRVAARVPDELLDLLWRQVTGDRGRERGFESFAATLLGEREFTDFARDWWPDVDASDVLRWLADRERLARDAAGTLSAQEVSRLAESFTGADFSVEDVPLLDELRYLLGERSEREPDLDPLADLYDETFPELADGGSASRSRGVHEHEDRPTSSIEDDSYAHVLIDEAQDLSPMQWRMLGRRGRQATWTVVGDPAQSSWPHRDEAAAARREALGGRDQRSFRLSTNYRNSREIFELAAEFARTALPGADLPDAVRTTGVEPWVHVVEPADLASTVSASVTSLGEQVDGTVGIVVPRGWRETVDGWLGERDRDRLPILEALETKGLEFDAAVVVEPDEVVAESVVGMSTLYVVLTRATLRLAVIGTSHRWLPLTARRSPGRAAPGVA
jgi:RecA/RadA recombinase